MLEGDAAKAFLQKCLANSTFNDCPAGWPNCAVEQRYSHAPDATLHYCRLTSVSGADIRTVGEYGVDNAKVEPDGSWIFHEVVQPSSAIEKIGPSQYVGGVAKTCDY